MKKVIKNILLSLLVLISFVLLFAPTWIRDVFGDVTFEQIAFHLMVPMEGADTTSYVIDGLIKILLPSLILSSILIIILKYKYKYILQIQITVRNKSIIIKPPRFLKIFIVVLLVCASFLNFFNNLNIMEYIKLNLTTSSFIEENYVYPDEVNIKFPEKKRNLIYIMLESMESSYASADEGGVLGHNLIPNLTKLANENISFSDTEKLGGAYNIYGSTWTIAAMVSHFSGIPLRLCLSGNSYGEYSTFLPGIKNLGDILDEEEYNQLFILGSDIAFGGRDKYMIQHGNFSVFDYTYAVKNDYYNDDYVWWGYDDEHLYQFAKQELQELASKEEPFNFTLLTVDTHFEDGYLSGACTDLKYDDKYSNVISCADNMVYEFVNWIKQQDFYENTTIVIVGDHLTMDVDFFENYKEKEKDRRIYNTYINSVVQTDNIKNRQFSTMDLFPTTLASLGVTIEGDKLGLGTNLFSESETLIEKYGFKYVDEELGKKSKYYDDKFLFDIKK